MTDLHVLVHYLKRHMTHDAFAFLVTSGVPSTGPTGLRRWVAERDLEAFAKLYFPEEFHLELADIHKVFVRDIADIRRRALAAQPGLKVARAIPRGHSKTSWYSRLMPLHGLLYGWSPLTILLGNNATSAERLLKNIRDSLEANELLAQDFPGVRGEVWQSDHLQSADGCSIRCFGVGSGAVRGVSKPGQRPSLIIGDDLDDDASVRSAIQLESNTSWWDKAVMSLGDQVAQATSYVVVGTVIRKSSLMSHILSSPAFHSVIERGVTSFSSNPDLWNAWRDQFIALAKQGKAPPDADSDVFYQTYKDKMLEGTAVLWNRPNAYYTMMVYRLSQGEAAFESEIQNTPGAASQLLGAVPFVPMPTDLKGYQLLASLDPTVKGGSKTDKAAWVELLFHQPRKELIVVFCNAEQRPAAQTIDYVLSRMRLSMQPGAKRYDGLWCEDNSAGSLVADSIEERTGNEGLFYTLNRVNNTVAKEDRIAVLAEYAARKQFFVVDTVDEEFIHEWEGFGGGWKWDDALDAAATVVVALKNAGLLDLISAPY